MSQLFRAGIRRRSSLLFGFLLLATAGWAQTTTAPVEAAPDATAPVADKKTLDAQVVELTPFQVNSSKDQGYRATATMSGTRLNTALEDLAASISVVTKAQLEDTAAVDINDIFKYELSTEGTSQFTDFGVDRGVVTDNVQKEPSTANRLRGLTAANVALNGFSVNLPLDTYDIESVEISRGPNSTVFGLGNSGGGVNILKGHANTSRDITSFTTRADSYDGFRNNFDLNRVLIHDRLALRVYGLYEDKGYVRKPSEDITRRLEIAGAYRPFQRTTIYASFESYRNQNNRPNSLTPRDTITDWITSGKPTWDPITQTVHLANGTSIGPVASASEATLLPYGLAVSDSTFQNSPSAFYNPNGGLGLFMISRLPAATGIGPTNVAGTGRLLQSGSFYIRNSTKFPLYNPVQITDSNLYDWTSVNLAAPNFSSRKGETSSVQIQQLVFETGRQSLSLEAAWLQERIANYDRRFLGTGGASLQPYIDVNEKLLDGTPNPYFLRPYVGGAAPSTNIGRNNTSSYRMTGAYDLDLSREKNFLHWLGHHRFTAFGEYRNNEGGSLGYQDVAVSTNTWMGTVANRKSAPFMIYPRYYVGDAVNQNIDYAPAGSPRTPYVLPLQYFNGVTNQWITDPTTYDLFYGANRPNKRILSTYGGVWQGYFLDGRIVPLYGLRQDNSRSRDSDSAINPTAATNGFYDTSPLGTYTVNPWVQNKGRTDNEGIVVKPFKWISLSYNQANAFSPGSAIYDVNGIPLPDPHGESKDYGFSLRLFKDKLVITAKQFETVDIGRSTSDLNTIVQRAIRMDRRSSSGDPGLTDWYITRLQILNPSLDQATLVAQTLQATGADYDYLRSHINKTHGDASNSYSHGKEIEITYNPTSYWRMKLTGSQETPLNGILSPAVQSYIDSRMPTWTTIKDPVTGNTWWTTAEDNGTIPNTFFINNVVAPLKLAIALQGKRRSQTREYHISYLTNLSLAGVTDRAWLKPLDIGGSVRWESKASIGYLGAAADADGIVREYNPNAPVWQKGDYFTDLFAKYRLRFYNNKVQATIQLNVNNVFENGHLQAVQVNPDGSPWAFRIVDPRQFILSVKFDL